MASWDDEDFDPDAINGNMQNNWGGEDEDDEDIKDNWDDAEEEKEKKVVVPKSEPKKKRTFPEILKEKEEKRKQDYLAKQEEMKNMEENRELSPEEEIEEKLRRQRLQEESDLELAKDTFGVSDVPGIKTIDNFIPASKAEFQELATMIVQQFSNFEFRAEYPIFLETVIRDCCAGAVEPEDIKKISNTLNLLVQEKQKQSKVGKGKKKTAAASKKTLSTGKGTKKDELDYDDGYYNEFEDFM